MLSACYSDKLTIQTQLGAKPLYPYRKHTVGEEATITHISTYPDELPKMQPYKSRKNARGCHTKMGGIS